jgi:hypothetical protein
MSFCNAILLGGVNSTEFNALSLLDAKKKIVSMVSPNDPVVLRVEMLTTQKHVLQQELLYCRSKCAVQNEDIGWKDPQKECPHDIAQWLDYLECDQGKSSKLDLRMNSHQALGVGYLKELNHDVGVYHNCQKKYWNDQVDCLGPIVVF